MHKFLDRFSRFAYWPLLFGLPLTLIASVILLVSTGHQRFGYGMLGAYLLSPLLAWVLVDRGFHRREKVFPRRISWFLGVVGIISGQSVFQGALLAHAPVESNALITASVVFILFHILVSLAVLVPAARWAYPEVYGQPLK